MEEPLYEGYMCRIQSAEKRATRFNLLKRRQQIGQQATLHTAPVLQTCKDKRSVNKSWN
jgi:hypothetical protein